MGFFGSRLRTFATPSAVLATTLLVALATTAFFRLSKNNEEHGLMKPGLHVNDSKAFRGYTLFSPLIGSTQVFLIDMEGKVAHTWRGASTPASCAFLLENGNLLRPCLFDAKSTPFGLNAGAGGRVQEFTWDGELVWDFQFINDNQVSHHDVRKLPNGNLLMIVGEMIDIDDVVEAGRNEAINVRVDLIIEVKPTGKTTGEIVWQWHMWDHLIQDFNKTKKTYGDVAAHAELIDVNFRVGTVSNEGKGGTQTGIRSVDWTHTNAVDYNPDLDQIMLCVHNFNEIWIIDHSTTTVQATGHSGGKGGRGGDLLYRWGNPQAHRAGFATDQKLFGPHGAHWITRGLSGQGNVLVFNNGLGRPEGDYSSVEEVALPVDAKGDYVYKPLDFLGPETAPWTYMAPKKTEFFSRFISGAQRLPNGNTLICSGSDGIFFEVTPGKQIVWKYVNPARNATKVDKVGPGAVFRAYRYSPEYSGLKGRVMNPTGTVEDLVLKYASN